jgi:cytidylate kinase
VIAPWARAKFFVTAPLMLRAQRRRKQLHERGSLVVPSLEEIAASLQARDEADQNRAVAPLVPAPDAYHLYNEGKTLEALREEACQHLVSLGWLHSCMMQK